jgi:hypothetical protein
MADINLGVGGANSAVAGGYDIENSLKLEADNSEYLSGTIGSTSNRKTFTISCWFKRTELKAGASDFGGHMLFMSGVDAAYMVSLRFHTWLDTYADTLEFRVDGANNNNTTRRFRDTSAWYHIVLAVDTTQATEANRWKLYVNGVQETSFLQTSYPSQNADTYHNVANNKLRIGSQWYAGTESGYFAGYIADYYHIDGQALAPTDFGEFDEDSGIWKPKAYTGSFGTNGWYLDFVDGANLGDDVSGNGNNFTENNITSADQATDTPTNNFCTLNPIFAVNSGVGELTISEGGTRTVNAANAYKFATSTIGVTRGKWYWEVNGTYVRTISLAGVIMPYYWLNGNIAFSGTVYYAQSGQRYNNSSASSFGPGWGDGDIIAFALDMDASTPTLNVYKNNTSLGDLFSGLSLTGSGATFLPPKEDGYFAKLVNYGTNTFDINFGGYTAASISSPATDENGYGTFEYAPPTGYYALCTKNLAEYG